ncbi:MAG: hybrid sensor histidine kinase/response regulator [Desulfobacula sp. RIFOXYA12_FULL_46_16]|nr:MAG: hybrid sensor histidine kinase/response regulator [Candidatus Raymondbacteria bacterium RifOxyB12_full_50_8]OGR21660.1 MAG: hybrid sensor histidine kinase/response regulator [Desulfobacula sp. RIFOXYA12_FULL_46_16]
MFQDDETLQMYIEESLDHLGDIESDLLTIEEAGENIDLDLVNNVFRAAHSIKGGAGFMGLTTIKDLAHHLENVLGLIRNRELIPDSTRISVLLKGFDQLENLLKNIETSNETDVSQHITALENITKATVPEEKKEMVSKIVDIVLPDGRIFSQVSLFEMEQYKSEGKNIFLVEYDLIHDIQRKDKNPIEVLNSLQKTGVIIDSRIDFDSVGTLYDDSVPARIPFQVLFASIIEYDMTETLFDIKKQYIHAVSDQMVVAATVKHPSSEPSVMKPLRAQKAASTEQEVRETIKPARVENQNQSAIQTAKEIRKAEENEEDAQSSAEKEMNAAAKPQSSLRVNVGLLDTLMNLAGELVLSRNQLLQGINSSNQKATELSSQRIDMITSELQEAIMRTRMQPIANILNKFTRVVRDLSHQLGKTIDLIIEGKDVELDKTILESINDPLTHLIRNSVDHGIETPMEREQMGKQPTGKIVLKAFHEAGQVNIVISDDGKGLHPNKIANSAVEKNLISEHQVSEMSDKQKMELIFLPGFSTAKEVTDVSGRGVGMDVVVTNISNLGGIIELDSVPGEGTDIQIKLPLTLAIIPSQITSVGNERYAVPQVNLNELLRIPAAQVKEKIEKVGDAAVVRLRGELLPLLNLADMLGIEKTYNDPAVTEELPERRQNLADRRSKHHIITEEGVILDTRDSDTDFPQRTDEDRRYHSASAINIAVVSAGAFKYGLVVDKLLDSEEIVVKPVGRHLKKCAAYAGATIMGDGKVALILDISNLAQMAELSAVSEAGQMTRAAEEAAAAAKDKAALLTFKNSESEYFAAPLNLVERIERIQSSNIEQIGNSKVVQYRGGALPLYELSQVANFQPLAPRDQQEVIVFKIKDRELGLMVMPPIDAQEINLDIDEGTLKQPAISGSMIINQHTTLLVDIFEMVKILNPSWFNEEEKAAAEMATSGEKVILFAEDSAFFRNQVKTFMEEDGFKVIEAEDGLVAWELLNKRADEIDIVVTDLEMPNMDGFELTKRIKNDPKYSHLTVIALTSLASEAHIEKGKRVGIDEYEIKLDREKLMKVVRQRLSLSR